MAKLLDLLLQRNDSTVPWGFRASGGLEFGTHPIISSVTLGTLASQYLRAGDKILEIEKRKADCLPESEVNRIIENGRFSLNLLVEKQSRGNGGATVASVTGGERKKSEPATAGSTVYNGTRKRYVPESESRSHETATEREFVKDKNSFMLNSTEMRLRESDRNLSVGEHDLWMDSWRTEFKGGKDGLDKGDSSRAYCRDRMNSLSENFDRAFQQKIGDWLETNMLRFDGSSGKQQSSSTPSGEGSQSGQPPPPPLPSTIPGVIPGRRLKTEMPDRIHEPPLAIQNAMLTKDKKPFTYTPGGIDLSEIRSPRMQRRITRNACADEMPGIPAPTTNHQVPVDRNTNYSGMQSQLPSQVLPPLSVVPPQLGAVPPPPPPPVSSSPGSAPVSAPSQPKPPSASGTLPRPSPGGRPSLGFDPNELLARVNRSPAYEPNNSHPEEPGRNFRSQSSERKPNFEVKQQPKSNEIGQNIYVPLQNEPTGQAYAATQVTSKPQKESANVYASNQPPRGQLGSIYVPSVAVKQEPNTPSPSPGTNFRNTVQQTPSPVTSPPAGGAEMKQQAPWVTVYRTPQPSVPWAKPEPEQPPKSVGARIIPIQIEGRDSPKPASPSPQIHQTPPPFLQSQQARQQSSIQQPQPPRHQSPVQQQQQKSSNTRVIPIQIEGNSSQQPRSPAGGVPQSKFNSMTPQSPTPFSPSQDREQKPQWSPVQPKPLKKDSSERFQQSAEPDYGTYNTAGVPLSQLRKMQLGEDDRALMDKFKSQVEIHGNDILNDENTNPRYRGGYIPSRVFKMIDESVDEESYLHRESDPRYRGGVIPSRAFRMLQSMTDTAGDVQQQQQQVPRSPPREKPINRPQGGAQYQQEPSQGSYVPPSEQQVQEPRKYTGGSIPSRSFKILQAMTSQEVSASNSSGSSSGRETPIPGNKQWGPSPSPSPIDPYYLGYYPPDPYFLYNYITELNAVYGLPPPPPPSPNCFALPFHHPYHCQLYQNYGSDGEEQGYSSTDELARYHANNRRNLVYSPFRGTLDRSSGSTPSPFRIPRVYVTPAKKTEPMKNQDMVKEFRTPEKKPTNQAKERFARDEEEEDESLDVGDESETDTEIDEDGKMEMEDARKSNNLQTLKSVSNIKVYSESSSTILEDDHREEIEWEDEEMSSNDSFIDSEDQEPVSRPLSIIFEESDMSEVVSMSRRELECDSRSTSTIANLDESDEDVDDTQSSVTLRLPLKLKSEPSKKAKETTEARGSRDQRDHEEVIRRDESNPIADAIDEQEEECDVSVTFTISSRSNSVVSVESNRAEVKGNRVSDKEDNFQPEVTEASEECDDVAAEVTIRLPRPKITAAEGSEDRTAENESQICESPQTEDDSSSTSLQSSCTILDHKEDGDEEGEGDKNDEEIAIGMSEDWNEEKQETDDEDCEAGKASRELEEMLISMLESSEDNFTNGMEESEEDDSGVTSDMSIKQMNSETDADTESDYSELSKMTKFQRASTHSRLFKLLQDECGKCDKEDEGEGEKEKERNREEEETLSSRKQRLTLPLRQMEMESLSSCSDVVSPCSPIVSDRLVKELIHSLLKKKKGKKFRKLPLAKLYAAAVKILQEEVESHDGCHLGGEGGGGLFLPHIQNKRLHSKFTAQDIDSDGLLPLESTAENSYSSNYYDIANYYNTWDHPDWYYPEDYDVVPSKAFRSLKEQTDGRRPKPIEGFKARCPRVASKKNVAESAGERAATPAVAIPETENEMEFLTFAEKKEKVSRVLEKH